VNPEQQANLDACVRKGFAIRLNKKRVTAAKILEAIDRLLDDGNARQEVLKFKNQLEQWNGPENAAKFLYETFA